MRDKDGFVIRCIHSHFQVINENDDAEFVCRKYGGHFCYGDEDCKGYEPEGEKMTNNGLRVPDPPEYGQPEYEGCPYGYAEFEQGDECIGCVWREACKEVMKE